MCINKRSISTFAHFAAMTDTDGNAMGNTCCYPHFSDVSDDELIQASQKAEYRAQMDSSDDESLIKVSQKYDSPTHGDAVSGLAESTCLVAPENEVILVSKGF